MKHIVTPNSIKNHNCAVTVFLAGSISGNDAMNWQQSVVKQFEGKDVAIFNPRMTKWEGDSITHARFVELVDWDWNAMDEAEHVIVCFDGDTESPVTLMELGMLARSNPSKVTVMCPQNFWRKKHVDVLCNRYDIRRFDTLDRLIDYYLLFVLD